MKDGKYIKSKYTIDFIASIIILFVALPFMLLIFIVLTIVLKSFPLIVQKRGVTTENQVFNLYKFKTIKLHSHHRINCGSILFKPDLSPYVPAFCKWLRKTGLDELPQIVNVLKGEMSLIGPRPLTMSDIAVMKAHFPQYYSIRNFISVKPGITGMWQVFGNRNDGIGSMILLDLHYYSHVSLSIDFKIFIQTILLVARGKHSDAIFSRLSPDNEYDYSGILQPLLNCKT